MPERYRFRLPDGQEHESDRGKAWIERTYPGATIVGRVVSDDAGQGIVVPFQGKQPEAKTEDAPGDAEKAPQSDDDTKKAEPSSRARKAR